LGLHWIYAHLVGDFLIQTDWMANGKKRSSWICFVHVATYMIPFLFTSLSWLQLACIAAEHFLQDRTRIVEWFMKHAGKNSFAEPPKGPWSLIVVDNIFHILFIAMIEKML
jgi:hypothetical protein